MNALVRSYKAPAGSGAKPVHVAFPRLLSQTVRDLAAEKGVSPTTLVTAAIGHMIEADLLDAVFDGMEAGDYPAGHGRKANGLTHLQCAVLAVFRSKPQRGAASIDHAVNCGAPIDSIRSAIKALEKRGFLRRISSSMHELTGKGADVCEWLTGACEDE